MPFPAKAEFAIRYPRVEGYTQAIRNRVTVDWVSAATLARPGRIPPEVEVKALLRTTGAGSSFGAGPGGKVTSEHSVRNDACRNWHLTSQQRLPANMSPRTSCAMPPHSCSPSYSDRPSVSRKKVQARPPGRQERSLSLALLWLGHRTAQRIDPPRVAGRGTRSAALRN